MRFVRRLFLPFALLLLALALPRAGAAQVAVSVTVAPPPLPVYAQPAIPGPGWIWTPGYWAWGPYGYYWVPGTWVEPPRVGLLWTPGYWGWADGVYLWHAGYWGPHVGFYGGIDYGFGYVGVGYFGGFWDHDRFRYNSAVNNFGGAHITNVYRQTIVNHVDITRNVHATRVSFNGGEHGVAARPTRQEEAFAREPHVAPTSLQARHETMARSNPRLRASVNHGRPAIAATARPAAFGGRAAHGPAHPQRQQHAQPQHSRRVNASAPQHGPRQAQHAPQHGPRQAQHAPQHGPQGGPHGPQRGPQHPQQQPEHQGGPGGGGDRHGDHG